MTIVRDDATYVSDEIAVERSQTMHKRRQVPP